MVIGIDCSRAFGRDRTGTENYTYYLVKEMLRLPAAETHEFVLYTRVGSETPDWTRQKKVKIEPIEMPYLWTQVGLAWRTWTNPKIDLLFVPAHTLPVLRKPGIKTVVTIHGLEYKWLPEYNNLLQRWYLPLSTYYAARSATKVIAVSNFTKEQIIEEAKIEAKKVVVILEGAQNAINRKNDKSAKILRELNLDKGKYILFVGTLQPRKNLPALIEAFARLAPKYPRLKLVLAGGKGWQTEEIFAAPSKWGVQNSVIFAGRVSDEELDDLYSGAALYAQPSITEGFGLPVVEAMRKGVPVVASSGGALAEVVGRSGVVVPIGPQFASNLAKQMDKVLSNDSYKSTLVASGHRRAKELNWQKAAEATLETLLNL